MILEINGERRFVPALENVRELLQHLGVGEEKIAVEINRRIVRRKEWAVTAVNDEDKIEIVQFVGGG
jgi:sulfur carrier protein